MLRRCASTAVREAFHGPGQFDVDPLEFDMCSLLDWSVAPRTTKFLSFRKLQFCAVCSSGAAAGDTDARWFRASPVVSKASERLGRHAGKNYFWLARA